MAGLHLAESKPNVVVFYNDPALDIELFQQAATASRRRRIRRHPDRWLAGPQRAPLIEMGTILAALRTAVDHANITIVGKPSRELFHAHWEMSFPRTPG